MREIVIDTETTGREVDQGHRIVEIACIELVNYIPTGRDFQAYINPERECDPGAFKVHNLSDEFLATQKVFSSVVEEFVAFIGESKLVIHNAPFDMGFINAELKRCGYKSLPSARAIDTLRMARRKFPGASNSLDALCQRFSIDLSKRSKHGALIDCHLLADVYLELKGGRQHSLDLESAQIVTQAEAKISLDVAGHAKRTPRVIQASSEELALHQKMCAKLAVYKEKAIRAAKEKQKSL